MKHRETEREIVRERQRVGGETFERESNSGVEKEKFISPKIQEPHKTAITASRY